MRGKTEDRGENIRTDRCVNVVAREREREGEKVKENFPHTNNKIWL